MKKWTFIFTSLLLLTLLFQVTAVEDAATHHFVSEMVTQHHFKANYLNALFAKAKMNQTVIDLMNKPYEQKPWYQYRTHFISQSRIQKGVIFWHRYRNILDRVSRKTGVPPSIIVAIIGVESRYGAMKGTFPAFDVLYTFAFHYPRRSKFFQNELKEFLLLCREQEWDPLLIKGSYAAALGQPQFMPSSYRAYAKAYQHDKHINLFDHEPDVIASIANYFQVHGWQRNKPVATRAVVHGKRFQELPVQDRNSKITKPILTLKQLSGYGIKSETPYKTDYRATFIQFDLKTKKSYWLGFQNFYVITRYNTSKLYALAVYQLSDSIQKQYTKLYPDP